MAGGSEAEIANPLVRCVMLAIIVSACASRAHPRTRRDLRSVGAWAAVYGPLDDEELQGIDLLIVDPSEFSSPERARKHGARWVLAYLSVGELNENTADYGRYAERPWLIESNVSWPSWRVDVRDEEWRRHILHTAERLMEAGFDGLMLDTLSVASMLERREPARFAGSVEAMRELIRTLRRRHPSALLVPNGGLEVVDAVASELDGLLVEAVYGGFDSARGQYTRHRSHRDRRHLLHELMRIRSRNELPAFAIDYFSPADEAGARDARLAYDRLGIRYYLGPPDLRELRRR